MLMIMNLLLFSKFKTGLRGARSEELLPKGGHQSPKHSTGMSLYIGASPSTPAGVAGWTTLNNNSSTTSLTKSSSQKGMSSTHTSGFGKLASTLQMLHCTFANTFYIMRMHFTKNYLFFLNVKWPLSLNEYVDTDNAMNANHNLPPIDIHHLQAVKRRSQNVRRDDDGNGSFVISSSGPLSYVFWSYVSNILRFCFTSSIVKMILIFCISTGQYSS